MRLFTKIPEHKKTVIVTEEQVRMLKEATDGHFSTQELSALTSFAAKKRYCEEHLGRNVGRGSSRIVFQIDDEKVLKLAFNSKGVAQNEEEASWYKQNWDFIPKIYEVDDNYGWIVCEYVLPAKKQDFVHCLGITWEEFVDFVNTVFSQFARMYIGHDLDYDEMEQLTEDNEMLSELYTYITDTCFVNYDIIRICNWGLAQRNGNAYLVFLDHGFSQRVKDEYYTPKIR